MADSASFDLVIVAAGSGVRMGGAEKGLITVAGTPALQRVLTAASEASGHARIVLVVPAERVGAYAELPWLPVAVISVVAGGPTRAASVAAGIEALERAPGEPAAALLIHDVARPGVTAEMFEQVAAVAARVGAAIPALPIHDTVKRIQNEADGSAQSAGTIDRTTLRAAQTPQGIARRHVAAFLTALLERGNTASDDASILESCDIPVALVDGAERLRKLTTPADAAILAALIATPPPPELAGLQAGAVRIGWGDDAHPVGASGELVLGGRAFVGSPALTGHSDGDVVLHAVADALLGAAGLGDLGRIFPADARTPKGVASSALLSDIVSRCRTAGTTPLRVDLLITAKEPQLAPHLDEIAANVARLLGLPTSSVNAKASTGNLVGDEGVGRAIRCTALVLAQGEG